ncbi:hypothetical protein INR49_013947 [Caranx melampygus]|nr:hypothetical protein INR49_013947 [Caranx melampygus]
MQRSGDAPPLPLQHQHLQTEQGDLRLEEDAPRSVMLTAMLGGDITMRRPTEGRLAQSREQSSRIKGHRRAAGRVDSTRSRGASGRTAEKQQQPRGGRIAVSGDERQGQCGSQQADRGEEAAEICDTSPSVPTALSPPYYLENMMVDAFKVDQWQGWNPEGTDVHTGQVSFAPFFSGFAHFACRLHYGLYSEHRMQAPHQTENIVVYEVSASIDQCPTIIEENSPIVLRYKTPYFRASAGVVMPPVPRNETWVVGWIQACTQMEFYNTYGDIGMSSWELPELREGRVKAISDSDGVSYPWYGNTTETVTLTGPTSKPSRLTVSMNDNFYPSVTWAVPISNSNTPMLTHITRDQSFITWLVAMNSVTKERIVLQTVRWRMRVDIAVDPDMPLGSRATLMGRPYQEQPHILNYQEPIPPNALGRPNANDAQVLMWRPRRGAPLVVIPPK